MIAFLKYLKTMKNIIRISILILLFAITKNKCEAQDLTLNAEITDVGWSGGFECNWPAEYVSVKIILKNNSNIQKTFWIMTSSWQDSFISDVDSVEFLLKRYSANFPTNKELKPNQSITFINIVKIPKTSLKYKEFKIGFVMFNERELMDKPHKDKNSIQELMKNHKIYWSNTLSMNEKPMGYDESEEKTDK